MSEFIYASQLNNIEIDLRRITKSIYRKNEYYNYPVSFDIETSSFLDHGEPRAIMYVWQMCFGDSDLVVIGRTWEEWLLFIRKVRKHFHLKKTRILCVYVHNLSYEFQFIRKFFEWESVFALDKRVPLYARTNFGIEFRCSYRLSGYNLKTLAENLQRHKIQKLVGDLDYKKIRTPETPITEKEMGYNVNDVRIVCAYISECLEKSGHNITKIPLTKTGYVRTACKHACFEDSGSNTDRYRNMMKKLIITPEEYTLLKCAFAGGYTHANSFYTGETLTDVTSQDFTSSYPYVLFAYKFPWSKGELCYPEVSEVINTINIYSWIIDIEFYGIESVIMQDDYISRSKCIKISNYVVNNGRVNSADYLRIVITSPDLDIILKTYRFKEVRINKAYRYYNNYLPTSFIMEMLSYYVGKTKLKGVAGKEEEYLYNKEQLNSFYGMIVTSPLRPIITYKENEWGEDPVDLEKGIEKYNKSRSRFMFYPVGVFVTAYARHNLWSGILAVGNDYVYSDTDSIKLLNYENHKNYFDAYNASVYERLETACKHHGIDISNVTPETIKGVKKPLGVWDYDGHYKRFKTLGAKRYLYEYDSGDISLTVAGLNKKTAIPYLLEHYTKDQIFEMFAINDAEQTDFIIPEGPSGRMVSTYIDSETSGTVTDYKGKKYEYYERSAVHLGDTTYTLSLAQEYIKFLLGRKDEIQ